MRKIIAVATIASLALGAAAPAARANDWGGLAGRLAGGIIAVPVPAAAPANNNNVVVAPAPAPAPIIINNSPAPAPQPIVINAGPAPAASAPNSATADHCQGFEKTADYLACQRAVAAK